MPRKLQLDKQPMDKSGNTKHNNGTYNDTNINDSDNNESPLQLFGNAKIKINDIYKKLADCVSKASNFYADESLEKGVVKCANLDHLDRLNKSIETIRIVLARNQMKVAFFGRTSNGKSTAINAILHDKVLPTGFGHTTNCFLQIEGTRENEAYMEVDCSNESKQQKRSPIQSVSHIANALSGGALEYSTLVKIHWPISKCPLLKYDVVLVDSPGVDVEENLDKWIDEHCHDADVFVLVSNAESTLNIAEKNFFHKVSEKLSKPSLFVLNNRWDAIDDEPDCIDVVRKQHIDRAVQFLSDELKIADATEAKKRTFFVSAKEMLQTRMTGKDSSPSKKLTGEGYKKRCTEFIEFERKFEECLSKSAVRTKFKKHTDKGKDAIVELKATLTRVHDLGLRIKDEKHEQLGKFSHLNDLLNKSLKSPAQQRWYEMHIQEIKHNIHDLCLNAFEMEVHRLARVVDYFDDDFVPNPVKLVIYKERLYNHVEEVLGENIRNQFHKVVSKHVNPFIENMQLIGKLLPEKSQNQVHHVLQHKNLLTYDETFNLRTCRQAYSDFQEDLEFRFSLGLFSIVRKFRHKFLPSTNPRLPINNTTSNEASLNSYELSETNSNLNYNTSMAVDRDFLAIIEKFVAVSPQSPTTVGTLALGGVLIRTVGWKVIAATSIAYGALYFYEYLTWTNSAKKKAFKRQFVAHAKSRLKACVPIISDVVASSAEQRLTSCFKEVDLIVGEEQKSLSNSIELLKFSLNKLNECENFTSSLLGESDILMTELVAFASTFFS